MMSSLRMGFIGVGFMGEAILSGALRSSVIAASDIFVHDVDQTKLKSIADHYCVNACAGVDELLDNADVVLVAVKPIACAKLLDDIAQKMSGKAIISIVAGWNSEKIKKHLQESTRLLCVMPNMPALCGEGMSVLSANNTLSEGELQFASHLFNSFGEIEILDEKYFDIVTGLSGSGPAFVFMFIEAMMQAGIYGGLPQKTARKLAIQTVLGSAKVLKMNDRHPAEMRESVCTPAGTTIEGVFELETRGFTAAVIAAVDKSAKKFKQMTNN
jgi:pyrroline-5-carboxylate reductase